jgi:hypothetical protein
MYFIEEPSYVRYLTCKIFLSATCTLDVPDKLDDFDHCVIKRTIHGLYSRKIAPTISIIHKEIKDSIKISV